MHRLRDEGEDALDAFKRGTVKRDVTPLHQHYISDNPALGTAINRLVAADGAVIFSEATEIIDAKILLAKHACDQTTR